MVHLSVIRILRLRSAYEISIAGLVGFRFLLDSGLHVADADTEAPLAAARDVDDREASIKLRNFRTPLKEHS